MTKKTPKSKSRNKFHELKNQARTRTKSKPYAPELKRFEEHPFYKNLVKHAVIPLWEKHRQAKKDGVEIDLDEETLYHAHVAQYAISLFEALKRMHDIPYFLEQNPNLRWMENKSIQPQEWFIYHYASYQVIATGVFDTVLLIVNDVLKIDLKPGDVKRKTFLERVDVVESEVFLALLKIDGIVNKYRQERNKYVHRSERPEIDFVDNLHIYRFLKEAKEKGLYKGQLPKQALAHAYFIEQRGLKAAEMRKDTVEIFEAIYEFLDALNPIYFDKLSNM